MHGVPVGRARRALTASLCLVLTLYTLANLALPPLHPVLLSLHFTQTRIATALRTHLGVDDPDTWLRLRTPHADVDMDVDVDVDLDKHVALVLKTGYGTRARVAAQLHALALGVDTLLENTLVVADFAGELHVSGRTVLVHDVLAKVATHEALVGLQGSERLVKWRNLTAAVETGSREGEELARQVGWELDAIKFLPALHLAFTMLPRRTWYLLLDDDTFVPASSLRTLLAHLDASRPMYVGNPVGDYRARFAHGGSGVLLSRPAMERLFATTLERGHDDLLAAGYVASLSETWGDRLLATTLLRAGVALEERYASLFSGERPWLTRLWEGRFCTPLVSFHGLAAPSDMAAVGDAFRSVDDAPVTAATLWGLYASTDLDLLAAEPLRKDEDYVGKMDDGVTRRIADVRAADACLAECRRRGTRCLAWTWEHDSGLCHVSPAMIVGESSPGKWSGINAAHVRRLLGRCATGRDESWSALSASS